MLAPAVLSFAAVLMTCQCIVGAPTAIPDFSGTRLDKRVLLPSLDPFYTPPSGYASTAPGTVLRSRPVVVATLGILPDIDVTAYQLLYRTNGALAGTPGVTVTTVIQPVNASAKVLVSYQFAEDSNNLICAPSYVLQEGSLQTNTITDFESSNLALLLLQGWTISASPFSSIVPVPDYEGAKSSFSAGRLSGHGVLDGIKAALSFSPLGLSPSTKVVGWGYSGGAIATGWAAALHPTYAPSLNVVGWAHGGTPANISGTLAYLDGTLFAGFGVAGVAGLSTAYPTIAAFLNTYATPLGKAGISLSESQCAESDIVEFAFQRIQSKAYQAFGSQLLYQPTVKAVTDQNILGKVASETPSAPLFVYHALYDEIIPIADVERMVQSYCTNGIKSLQYVRDIGLAEHASAEILFTPAALQFLTARVAGDAAPTGCTASNTTTVAVEVDALGEEAAGILQDLSDLLNTAIGVDDGIWKSGLQQRMRMR